MLNQAADLYCARNILTDVWRSKRVVSHPWMWFEKKIHCHAPQLKSHWHHTFKIQIFNIYIFFLYISKLHRCSTHWQKDRCTWNNKSEAKVEWHRQAHKHMHIPLIIWHDEQCIIIHRLQKQLNIVKFSWNKKETLWPFPQHSVLGNKWWIQSCINKYKTPLRKAWVHTAVTAWSGNCQSWVCTIYHGGDSALKIFLYIHPKGAW